MLAVAALLLQAMADTGGMAAQALSVQPDNSPSVASWMMGIVSSAVAAAMTIVVQRATRDKKTASETMQEAILLMQTMEQFRQATTGNGANGNGATVPQTEPDEAL